MPGKASVPWLEGIVRHLLFHHLLEQLHHLELLRFILIKGVPGIIEQFLQLVRAHLFGLKHHLVRRVVVPVAGEDAVLPVQLFPGLGVGERGQDREFGQIKLDLQQKIDQPFDEVFIVIVEPQEDRALHPDAVVVVALDPLLDIIRGVEDRLIHVPGPGLGREVEDLGLVFNGMGAPFLFERDHFPEQVHLPLGILGQGVVHDEEPVVVDAGHLGYRLVDGPGPEDPAAQVGDGAGVAVEAAAARGVDQVNHLHALVVVELAVEDIPARRTHQADIGPILDKIVAGL